jgi:hypothetical protein
VERVSLPHGGGSVSLPASVRRVRLRLTAELRGLGHPSAEDSVSPVARDLAEVGRLQHDLEAAQERYQRTIAEVEMRAAEARGLLASCHRGGARPVPSRISLSSADLEDLRALGLSVTQATRVLRFRRHGELECAADLDRVPGFSKAQRTELKRRLKD